MVPITVKDITAAVDGRLICGNEAEPVTAITTDSRAGGGMFVAIKGDNFDGNDFAAKYLKAHDTVLVSRELPPMPGKNIIYCGNTAAALLRLAAFYRSLFDIPVIGITGSVGKTSTKEIVYSVISQQYETLKTQGNFNNEIGVPLTLLGLEKRHRCAVVEMGMSHFGEMSRLSDAVKPDIAIITNIGTAHIGNLGSRENILKAKLEILDGMSESGTLILNGDDDLLCGIKDAVPQKTLYYGIENKNVDLYAENTEAGKQKTVFFANGINYEINAPGVHNVYNALAAILAARLMNIGEPKTADGVRLFENCGMRQNIIDINDITLIEDCYNASTVSVAASLRVLNDTANGRKIAVIGDILEQGNFAEQSHREVGRCAAQNKADLLLTVGESSRYAADEARKCGVGTVVSFDTTQAAAEYLKENVRAGDTVLFKASHGIHLEDACTALKQYLQKGVKL